MSGINAPLSVFLYQGMLSFPGKARSILKDGGEGDRNRGRFCALFPWFNLPGGLLIW